MQPFILVTLTNQFYIHSRQDYSKALLSDLPKISLSWFRYLLPDLLRPKGEDTSHLLQSPNTGCLSVSVLTLKSFYLNPLAVAKCKTKTSGEAAFSVLCLKLLEQSARGPGCVEIFKLNSPLQSLGVTEYSLHTALVLISYNFFALSNM